MHTKASALSYDAIEQHRRLLRQFIIFDEQLLEFVDDRQDTRHRNSGMTFDPACNVLDTGFTEHFATALHDSVEVLECAQSELALTFDPMMSQWGIIVSE